MKWNINVSILHTELELIGHSSPFVHVLLISIQLQTDTKTSPILFIKYRNWYSNMQLSFPTWTKNEFYQVVVS